MPDVYALSTSLTPVRSCYHICHGLPSDSIAWRFKTRTAHEFAFAPLVLRAPNPSRPSWFDNGGQCKFPCYFTYRLTSYQLNYPIWYFC